MAQPNNSGLRSQLIISGAVVVGVYALAGVGFAVVAALVAAAVIVIKHQAGTPARRVAAAPRPPQRQRGGQRRPKRGELWYATLGSQDEASSSMAPCFVVEVAGGSATVFPLTKEDQHHRPNFLPFRPPPGSKLGPGSLHTVARTVELGHFGRWAETRCPPELRQEVDRRFPPGPR